MSATGMGVVFWPPFIQTPNAGGIPAVPGVAMYLADRDYTITHVYLCNIHTAASVVYLGITLGGTLLDNTPGAGDARKFFRGTLEPGQVFDMSTRIPLYRGWALMGTSSVGALGDSMVYGAITGEVSD